MNASDWLDRVIREGLARLAALSLEGAPQAAVAQLAPQVWRDALTRNRTFDEGLDAWRIRTAFRALESTAKRWPSPAHLIEAMPPRREAPVPKIAVDRRGRNLPQFVRDVAAKLRINRDDAP